MTAFAFLTVMAGAAFALGYVIRHLTDDERDGAWLPPERRRWRP